VLTGGMHFVFQISVISAHHW